MDSKIKDEIKKERLYLQHFSKYLDKITGEMPKRQLDELQDKLYDFFETVNPYLIRKYQQQAQTDIHARLEYCKSFLKDNWNNYSTLAQQCLQCLDIMELDDFSELSEKKNEKMPYGQDQKNEKIREQEKENENLKKEIEIRNQAFQDREKIGKENADNERDLRIANKRLKDMSKELEKVKARGSSNWKDSWKQKVNDLIIERDRAVEDFKSNQQLLSEYIKAEKDEIRITGDPEDPAEIEKANRDAGRDYDKG